MSTVLSREPRQMLSKVPEVTVIFWVIKVLGTTVGETAADFLNASLGLGLQGTSPAIGVFLLASLAIQVRYRRYVPWIYWLIVNGCASLKSLAQG
jgi:uncharacterized membrane-anchored protein